MLSGVISYYSKEGFLIVNATDKLLRLKEKDGSIVDLPSSVLPKPKSKYSKLYRQIAIQHGYNDPKNFFDSSFFINLDPVEAKVKDGVYNVWYKTLGRSCFDIFDDIENRISHNAIIVGTHDAALAWPDHDVVEAIPLSNGIIRADKFRSYLK